MNASRLVIEDCAVATVDPSGSEYGSGHLVVEGSRIVAVGEGPAPEELARNARKIDGGDCLATPGLVNCHHLYQWAIRGLAHCVHLNEVEVKRLGERGTGVAHCPSSNARLGAGIAPVAPLLGAGAPVGLGVDGAASNEAGELGMEMRRALLFARLAGGPAALTAREALELATIHGARCLGREAELGPLEPGKLADVALWRVDDLLHAGIKDHVTALVFGPAPSVELLLVNGEPVVQDAKLRTAEELEIAREIASASRQLAEKMEVAS
jgi:cytosine/adenosine deaminase-related metal-dependent hydrolase